MNMFANPPFVFSHIFAEGWMAGRRATLQPPNSAPQAAANPYTTEPDRERWSDGFAKGRE